MRFCPFLLLPIPAAGSAGTGNEIAAEETSIRLGMLSQPSQARGNGAQQ